MLGWWITVIQSPIENERDRTTSAGKEKQLAAWEAGVGSIDWLDQLVETGKISVERHGGYPDYYYGRAGEILPPIAQGPPDYQGMPVIGEDYFAPAGWIKVLHFNEEMLTACPPDEQITVMVWDLS